jgi:hypothetical protein
MKNQYLTSALTLLCLFLFVCGFSQDLDLIVTTKGDSIACRIDSITETHIYFEMKSQNNWAHTHIGLTGVSEYKRNAIIEANFEFKPGTSIIDFPKELPVTPLSMVEVRKNSIYVGQEFMAPSVSYERMFPLGDHAGITVRASLAIDFAFENQTWFLSGTSFLFGGAKHFFEPGFLLFVGGGERGTAHLSFFAGYRYQSPNGLLFRFTPIFGSAFGISLGLSIGYSF